MESQPTTEELLNKIKLLEAALEFYSNEEYYDHNDGYDKSRIYLDKGHQANFALSQIKKINEYNDSLVFGFNQLVNEIGDENTNVDLEKLNQIKSLLEDRTKKDGV